MATKFLEPGGDATFNTAITTTGGLWGPLATGSATIATDFVHGSHIKSIKFAPNTTATVGPPTGTCADTGTRISFYLYLNAKPSADSSYCILLSSGSLTIVKIRITTAGTVILADGANTQLGSNGATLSTGRWYRICLAYTITSTTVNQIKLFVDGTISITLSNATISATGSSYFQLGNIVGDLAFDSRASDFYIDNSSSLTDTGDIWVTAKRPVSNGTVNGFTTQIGAGSSGYGTGHSPQVNERALSTSNGWSMIGAGSAVTEEYTIEGASVGDIDISKATIIDYGGWIYQNAVVSETATMVTGGTSSTYATGTAANMVTSFKGSTTYPAGGTDIGVITSTDLTTFNLYEAGILVAYIPSTGTTTFVPRLLTLGAG